MKIAIAFWLNQEFGRRILAGIHEFARTQVNCEVLLLIRGQGQKTKVSPEVDGVVTSVSCYEVKAFKLRPNIPIVTVWGAEQNRDWPLVRLDYRQTGLLAAEHLLARGLRCVTGLTPQELVIGNELQRGLEDALTDANIELLPAPIVRSERDEQAIARWLKKLPEGTGIITLGDQTAKKVTETAKKVGRSVPEDIAVLGIGDDPIICLSTHPMLSSVSVPAERLGYLAAEKLHGILTGRTPPRTTLIPPVTITARGSTNFIRGGDHAVHTAIGFMRDHFTEPIDTESVASEVGLARRTLEQRFRRVLGHSVHTELVKCRLARARHLLAATDVPIKAVAIDSGYRSLEHFSRFFKKQVGVTPSEYRQRSSDVTHG